MTAYPARTQPVWKSGERTDRSLPWRGTMNTAYNPATGRCCQDAGLWCSDVIIVYIMKEHYRLMD